jgi:hypothetical protein
VQCELGLIVNDWAIPIAGFEQLPFLQHVSLGCRSLISCLQSMFSIGIGSANRRTF